MPQDLVQEALASAERNLITPSPAVPSPAMTVHEDEALNNDGDEDDNVPLDLNAANTLLDDPR